MNILKRKIQIEKLLYFSNNLFV